MNTNLNCVSCKGKCNKKGYPSVTKNSIYYDNQRNNNTIESLDLWKKAKTLIKKCRPNGVR